MHYQQKISSSYGRFDAPEFDGNLTLKLFRNALRFGEVVAPNYTRKKMANFLFRPRKRKNDPKDTFLATATLTDTFTLKAGIRCQYYLWGGQQPDVLLVHGWESKASHFGKLINILVEKGFCVAAFDAVAHGQSEGVETDMLDFMECISQLHGMFSRIDSIIGYSFGGISAVNAIKAGLPVKRLGLISSPSSFYGIFEKVAAQLNLSRDMKQHLENVTLARYQLNAEHWDSYSAYSGVEHQAIPLVAIHDVNDTYVHKIESDILVEVWPNATLIETQKLGHRGIITSEPALHALCDRLFSPQV